MTYRRSALDIVLVVLMGASAACQANNNSIGDKASTAPPCTTIGQTWTSPVDGATLDCVPAGEFLMGAADADHAARSDEKPRHQVYLDAYWIDRTEVTNANYARCLAADACHPKVYDITATTYIPYAVQPAYQDYPALLYDFEAVAAYCHWAGRRLPTEAEWEKAARGIDGRPYPWGNEIDCSRATYYGCTTNTAEPDNSYDAPHCGYSNFCQTVPVDAHSAGASPYGALNMAGNVWEWVADWYAADYYAISPARNPSGPAAGKYKVLRGGGNKSFETDLRATARAGNNGGHFFDGQLGFRCAVSATP